MERDRFSVIVTPDELAHIAAVAEASENRPFMNLVASRREGVEGVGRLGVRTTAEGEERFSFPATQQGILRSALETPLSPTE